MKVYRALSCADTPPIYVGLANIIASHGDSFLIISRLVNRPLKMLLPLN